MRSVNKVILIGNITRDPSLRQTPSGQSVATFGIATNRQWTTKGTDRHSSTEFHEIVVWSKLAELADRHLRKGKLVYIEGYLSTRSWETPEGTKKFKTEIVAQDIIILNKRDDSAESDHDDRDDREMPKAEPVVEAPKQEVQATAEPAVEQVEPVAEAPATEAPAEENDNLIDRDLGL